MDLRIGVDRRRSHGRVDHDPDVQQGSRGIRAGRARCRSREREVGGRVFEPDDRARTCPGLGTLNFCATTMRLGSAGVFDGELVLKQKSPACPTLVMDSAAAHTIARTHDVIRASRSGLTGRSPEGRAQCDVPGPISLPSPRRQGLPREEGPPAVGAARGQRRPHAGDASRGSLGRGPGRAIRFDHGIDRGATGRAP